MANKLLVVVSLLIMCTAGVLPIPVHAQTLEEFTNVDTLTVGDTFDFSITLNRDQEYDQIILPDTTAFGSSFEVQTRKHFRTSEYKDSLYFKLQFFDTTDTSLPALPVYLIQGQDTLVMNTNSVPVYFKSLLSENEETFRPFKPIFEFTRSWWPYILGFLLIAIAGYFLYKYYTRHQKKEPKHVEPFTPTPFSNPLQELQQTIIKLEQVEPTTHEEFKNFYIDLGDAIRAYFESLHDIPALESTSGELLKMLRAKSMDESLIADTRAVLQEADMVKFANFSPTQSQAARALEKAHNFLRRAREVDGSRIDFLRRQHHKKMEAEQERYYQKYKKYIEENELG